MSRDTIYREDAIKALRKLGHEVVVIDKVCSLGVAGEFIDAIRTIPSADRPQGEWTDIYQLSTDGRMTAQCKNCREKIIFRDKTPNYCPNCGVRKGADDDSYYKHD